MNAFNLQAAKWWWGTWKHENQILKLSELCKGHKILPFFVAREMKAFNVNREKVNWLPLNLEVWMLFLSPSVPLFKHTHTSCSSDRCRKKYFKYQMTSSLYCGTLSYFSILKVISVWWFLKIIQLNASKAPSYSYKSTFPTVFATWLLNGFFWFWYHTHFDLQVQGILLQTLLQWKK